MQHQSHHVNVTNVTLITQEIPRVLGALYQEEGFPGNSEDKESACNAGDAGFIPEWGRSPGEGKGYNQWGCKKSDMTERLTLSLYFARKEMKTKYTFVIINDMSQYSFLLSCTHVSLLQVWWRGDSSVVILLHVHRVEIRLRVLLVVILTLQHCHTTRKFTGPPGGSGPWLWDGWCPQMLGEGAQRAQALNSHCLRPQVNFFFKIFFFVDHFNNLDWICYNIASVLWVFLFHVQEACGILAPSPGIKPSPPALEGKVLTTGPPGRSPQVNSCCVTWSHLPMACGFGGTGPGIRLKCHGCYLLR